MSNILSTTYACLSDEELLLRYRMGELIALDVLLARKNAVRHSLCHAASQKMKSLFGDIDINEIFFHGFTDVISTYEFSKGSFNSFLIRCLGFVMANRIDKRFSKSSVYVTHSLDDELNVRSDSSLVLSDVVSQEGTLDNPRDYMNYKDSIMEVTNLPKKISPFAIDIMRYRLEGYTTLEAAEKIGITYKRAAYIFARYAKWVKKVLKLGEYDADEDNDKD